MTRLSTASLAATLVLLLAGGISAAAAQSSQTVEKPIDRDPSTIAETIAKANTGNVEEGKRLHNYLYCSSCHGETGASPSRNWPSLTGQKADYTVKSLLDYRDNLRRDNYRKADLMHRVAKILTDEQIIHLAAYYASQPLPHQPVGVNKKLAKAGEILATTGDMNRGVMACAACHGAQGEAGVTPDTPALAGQTPEYFIQAMTMYRDDMRASDMGGMMRMVAKPLTDAEIKALAHYYASLGSKPTH